MKILSLLLLSVALLSTGCKPDSDKVQNFLNDALPENFTGDAHVDHKNPWFDFSVDAKNLRKVNGRWQWDSVVYHRNGRFSTGGITLTPHPIP